MHIKLIDGQPQSYSLGQLRRDNPQVSFPETIPADTLAEYDVFEVVATDPPTYDDSTHKIEQSIKLVDGIWTQTWVLVEHTAEDIDRQWANIRSERNQRLSACDWTQLSDAPLTNVETADWCIYRQYLRDITNQANPFNIQWPEKPA
jgi:hypothetical protein